MHAIHRRIRVTTREHGVSISMAVLAICAWRSCLIRLRMEAMCICRRRFDVAGFAYDFLRSCFVRKALHVLVAIDAGELHRSVDGVLKLLAIYKERYLLAIDVFGQGCVAMASEAVFIFQLVLGANGESRAQQKENEGTKQNSAGYFHAYEETPDAAISP